MCFICLIFIQPLTVCAGVILPLVETCLEYLLLGGFFGNELNTFALLLVAGISGPQKCKCEIAFPQTERLFQNPGFQQEDV